MLIWGYAKFRRDGKKMLELLRDKVKKKQLCYSYAVFMINGMLALSIGTLLPFIRDSRGLNYAFCGVLVSLHSCGNLVSSFASGALAVVWGRKKSILFFNAFFAIAFLLIAFGGSEWTLGIAFFITGLARGATSNFGNATINNLAPGRAAIINGLHAMFSIGAFLFPILLTVMTSTSADQWVYACYFMLAMGILSFILYFLMPESTVAGKKDNASKKGMGFFKNPLFILVTATLFFYLCAEQGVIGWLVTYFKDTGLLSANLSQLMSSVLWIAILAGRLTVAGLSTRVRKEKLLLFMGIGLVLFFIVLITAQSTWVIVIGILGFGYSMAGIYPTTVSFSGYVIQEYPMAWSFILTIASMGSILMPGIIGRIAEAAGIASGMRTIAAAVLIDLGFIIALTAYIRYSKKKSQPQV